ncbi:sugar ABC transporter substrate-binding protein [Ruminococcus gauvreauii]|uniref:sugar ABC transporter substrate-binding protein n=1 Tax=Ruminococcus gauvreauii TaxID=438033 RepID=UPI0039845D07
MIRKTLNMIILGIMVLGLSTGCAKSNDITDSETKEVSSGAEEDSESEGKFENLDPLDLSNYMQEPVVTDYVPEDCKLSGTKEDGTPWKIAWCCAGLEEESNTYMTTIMEGLAEKHGFELLVFDAQFDPQKQTGDVNNAITQNCDAVIVHPIDTNSQNAVMKKAKDNGLFVVVAQCEVDDPECYDMYVGPNDTEAGQMAASMLLQMMQGGGKLVCVEGNPGSTPQINRAKGFMGVIQQHQEFEILEAQGALNWSAGEAMSVMESYMSKYPEIDGVFCQWDIGTAACIQAADGVGRTDDMIFVSVDGVQAALDAIGTGGAFKGTAMQDFAVVTEAHTLAALAALNGDADKMEKECYIPFVCVTEENASNFEVGW